MIYHSIKDSMISSFAINNHEKLIKKMNEISNDEFKEKFEKKLIELNFKMHEKIDEINKVKEQIKTIKIELELKVLDLFDEVKLSMSCTAMPFSELDSKQKQKVFLVKSILKGKKFIIFSTPNFSDDENEMFDLLNIFKTKYGITFLLLTNNINTTLKTDNVAVIKDGLLCETNIGKELVRKAVHPHTKDLIKESIKKNFASSKEKKLFIKRTNYSILETFKLNDHHSVYSTKDEIDS